MQIHQQATIFAKAAGLRSVAVYGGAPKGIHKSLGIALFMPIPRQGSIHQYIAL
jgi:hypothetical protein